VCKYGAAKPSRPHLVWNGPETLHLRPPHAPFDRAEERFMNALLLLGILMVSAYDSFYKDIAQAVATSLQVSSQVVVATDGPTLRLLAGASFCHRRTVPSHLEFLVKTSQHIELNFVLCIFSFWHWYG
jgi:hypothetical protein